MNEIQVNQIGYLLKEKKIAITTVVSNRFQVIDKKLGATVYEGEPFHYGYDEDSGENVYHLDFTAIQVSGEYYIEAGGYQTHLFQIGNDIYKELGKDLLRFLLYQRCGMTLEPKFAGSWFHKACHGTMAEICESKCLIDVSGGWHDAGDYGRYTVPTAVTIGHLLLTYEYFPYVVNEIINIPESDNGIPDILNEAKWGISWLLKMQNQSSGGVYHKVTTKEYPPDNCLPEEDNDALFVSRESTEATADFAGVMAKAAYVYKSIDFVLSKRCLEAAVLAWSWLEQHKDFEPFTNTPGIHSFDYADEDDLGKRFWAACELYRVTGEKKYHSYIRASLSEKEYDLIGFGWRQVGGFGSCAYLSLEGEKTDRSVYMKLFNAFTNQASQYAERVFNNGYLISMQSTDFEWGSNMILLVHAMQLIIAGKLTGNSCFIGTALEHVHYLLGRNPVHFSYVSGYGTNPVRNLHHRQCMAKPMIKPIPGMVSGGANCINMDEHAVEKLQGYKPAKCYSDNCNYYSINEVTTYWNTAALFVVSCFQLHVT